MYEKPMIVNEEQEKNSGCNCLPNYHCGCYDQMTSQERYCQSIGAWYCWCKPGHC